MALVFSMSCRSACSTPSRISVKGASISSTGPNSLEIIWVERERKTQLTERPRLPLLQLGMPTGQSALSVPLRDGKLAHFVPIFSLQEGKGSVKRMEQAPMRQPWPQAASPISTHLFHCRRRISSRVHIMEPRRRQFTEAGTRS